MEQVGKFSQLLRRNNKQIRDDRATQIVESTQLKYKRLIEDLEIEIKDLQRSRDSLLDLSPANTQSLTIGLDFDPNTFVKAHMDITLKIRNSKIQLNEAKEQYSALFDPINE
jgi:hypothetical protein